MILEICIFDNLLLVGKLFTKALWNLTISLSFSNSLFGNLVWSLELLTVFGVNLKATSVEVMKFMNLLLLQEIKINLWLWVYNTCPCEKCKLVSLASSYMKNMYDQNFQLINRWIMFRSASSTCCLPKSIAISL